MQKFNFFTLLIICLVGHTMYAQSDHSSLALEYIKTHYQNENKDIRDVQSLNISSSVYNKRTNATYFYINQAINGIDIKNAVANVVITDEGKVVSFVDSYIDKINDKIKNTPTTISPEKALQLTAKQLGIAGPKISFTRNEGDRLVYAGNNISLSEIRMQPKYVYTNEELVLTWESTIDMIDNADYWEYYVDAGNGDFVDKINMTVYCSHEKGSYHNHDRCIHKTQDIVENQISEMLVASGSYKVYPIPTESPIHGDRVLLNNPHIPEASPFGWHDVNGDNVADYTITRGNNVHAYADYEDFNAANSDDPEPDGTSALVFDFPHDLDAHPRDSEDAAVTNLFYMTNMMHDITYLHGFDEDAGNFQTTNFGNFGEGNDEVEAQAFDGFRLHERGEDLDPDGNPTKINNANFSTPQDGFSGRMQMFLWDDSESAVYINSPSSIEGFILEYGNAQFGNPIPENLDEPLTASVALAQDGTPGSSTQNCNATENTAEINGKIALVDRGLCDFSLKAFNVQQGGAIGLIICNVVGVNGGDGDEILNMAAGDNAAQVTIPSIFMRKSDCDQIKLALGNGEDVVVTFHEPANSGPSFIDGAFDNGVIAHEFGHGISNRLVAGPNNTGCLGNQEQMGEGWSDFFSLIMTAEEGDTGADRRGIGNFADGSNVDGRGIRRFPYSTDMSICPLTYDDVKTGSIPHGVGEIWAAVLWDLYWAFVDLYGFDEDLTNLDSGNGKAVSLVMEAMKHTPCQTGYVGGRNGIFQADLMLFNGEHECMIWEVFARRGLGYFADEGSTNNVQDGIEDFSSKPTCLKSHQVVQIGAQGGKLTNAGDEVTLTVDVTNYVGEDRSDLLASVDLPDGLSYVDGTTVITYGDYDNLNPDQFVADTNIPQTFDVVDQGTSLDFSLPTLAMSKTARIEFTVVSDIDRKSTTLFYDDLEEGINEDEGWFIETENFDAIWFMTDIFANSGEYSQFIENVSVETDASIFTGVFNIPSGNPVLRFYHRYETEQGADGGFLMTSTDGGNAFEVENNFFRNGYNTSIQYGTFAIPGLSGFSGSSNFEFIDSYVDLSPYQGQTTHFRFRFGSDEENSVPEGIIGGWFIDDIEMMNMVKYPLNACVIDEGSEVCVNMDDILIDSDQTVGTNEAGERFSLEVFPNPANDYISLKLQSDRSEKVNASIISLDGRVLKTERLNVSAFSSVRTIGVSDIGAGIYILQLESEGAIRTEKITIF